MKKKKRIKLTDAQAHRLRVPKGTVAVCSEFIRPFGVWIADCVIVNGKRLGTLELEPWQYP